MGLRLPQTLLAVTPQCRQCPACAAAGHRHRPARGSYKPATLDALPHSDAVMGSPPKGLGALAVQVIGLVG